MIWEYYENGDFVRLFSSQGKSNIFSCMIRRIYEQSEQDNGINRRLA